MISSAELRQSFLDFFHQRGHEIVPSSPLVPGNDPTLLFTNAGMVQFKDVFLGRDPRSYNRATTSQRCVRAGGKHNDLENVGYTARHHTFFEMLGNFSFGDYFKRDAIGYAWEYLTVVLQLPAERLWVTVYEDDDEAASIWLDEIGVDPTRFSRIGAKDNFWAMGDTGPCGPCSEIFYDHGPEVEGGPPGTPEEDGDRYIEIWNLVFMQYDRSADGTLTPLPRPSVDTGMGLERLAAVLQHVHSNYDIDLFRHLIAAAAQVTGCADQSASSLRVIADHIRSSAFLIIDGVMPDNEGRGYVLRRIMRRAIRHGYKLGCNDAFFHQLVAPLVQEMGAAFPELAQGAKRVEQIILQEEQRFAETLEHGMNLLERDLAELKGNTIPGETVFRLYDTYGFPVDLTADIARERAMQIDLEGFEQAMAQQRERARAASRFGTEGPQALDVSGLENHFTGYAQHHGEGHVLALFDEQGQRTERLAEGDRGTVVLSATPFYAESGGQIGDCGEIRASGICLRVLDTRKQDGVHLHVGQVSQGALQIGDRVQTQIDVIHRRHIMQNHSATHLLHAALRNVLGTHVAQRGSLVDAEHLRFDFSHHAPVDAVQLDAIERLVNTHIRHNTEVSTRVMPLEQAMNSGAMALFGEKYGEHVRVVDMGEFSIELCGGTHVGRLGEIGLFKLVHESGVASGVRRVEALTAEAAIDHIRRMQQQLDEIADLVKGERGNPQPRVQHLVERNRQLERELDQLKSKLASGQGGDLASRAVEINGIQVVAGQIEGADARTLREAVDQLKTRLGRCAVVLSSVEEGKVRLVAGVSADCIGQIKAGVLVNAVAAQVGGKGGGKPDLAQAGGSEPDKLPAALASVPEWVRANT